MSVINNLKRSIENKIKNQKEEKNKSKENKEFVGSIDFIPGFTEKVVKEMKKRNKRVAIRRNKNIFDLLRNEKGNINGKQTSGIYEIPYEKEDGTKGVYIGQTKRKIEKRIEEHKRDVRLSRETTALAKLARKEEITIHFDKARKIAGYRNKNYANWRETAEIFCRQEACNDNEPKIMNKIWRRMLREQGAKSKVEEAPGEAEAVNTTRAADEAA